MENETVDNRFPVDVSDPPAIQTTFALRSTAPSRRLFPPLVSIVMAGFGIFGGVSSLFAGVICAVLHSVVPSYGLDRGSTVLLVIAIPMILIGTIFLDEIRPSKK